MSLPDPAPNATALVTGASSGIGVELARALVNRGHGVTLVARRADKLEELAQELRRAGVRVECVPADLSDSGVRAKLHEQVNDLGLAVEVLVNCAGLTTVGPVETADPHAELNMIAVNNAAVVDLCTRFVPGMVVRRRGAVLNVASTASFQPMPAQAAYAASKAFVLSYTEALRGEVSNSGVTVTALCPGPVATELIAVAGFLPEELEAMPTPLWKSPKYVAEKGIRGMHQGRMVVVPGMLNRGLAFFAHLAPNSLVVPIVASKHPRLRARGKK